MDKRFKTTAERTPKNQPLIHEKHSPGALYIVATPIGNLEDITFRAARILAEVDFIAAEDTRHSRHLLDHLHLSKPMIALHEHNEEKHGEQLLSYIQQGKSVALITDAGTPLVSDPGYFLVRKAHELALRVVPIPGCCSIIAALSVAGLATDRFLFEGFLPAKSGPRLERLRQFTTETRTLIFLESPHRILDSLQDLASLFEPTRQLVIARELTKKFEEILRGSIQELQLHFSQDPPLGEMVLLLAGTTQTVSAEPTDHLLKTLLEELPLKQAVQLAVRISGERKNTLYEKALKYNLRTRV